MWAVPCRPRPGLKFSWQGPPPRPGTMATLTRSWQGRTFGRYHRVEPSYQVLSKPLEGLTKRFYFRAPRSGLSQRTGTSAGLDCCSAPDYLTREERDLEPRVRRLFLHLLSPQIYGFRNSAGKPDHCRRAARTTKFRTQPSRGFGYVLSFPNQVGVLVRSLAGS